MKILTTIAITSLIALTPSLAQAVEVTDWVDIFDGFSNSSLTNSDTSNPAVSNATKTSIAAKFPAITLADGKSITLSGSMTVNGSIGNGDYRIGLFDSPDPIASSGGDNYVGVYAQSGLTTSTCDIKSRVASTGIDHPFDSTATTSLGDATASGSYVNNSPLSFSLALTRNGSTLKITSSFTQSGGYSVSGTVNYTPADFTYDTAAFLHAANFANAAVTYSGIQVVHADAGDTGNEPTDSDDDGMPDSYELLYGFNPAIDDSAESPDGDTLSNLQEYLGADGIADTGDETSPLLADTDGDGDSDNIELTQGTDPNDPAPESVNRLFGIDFNRNDALGSPSQSLFRKIAGSSDQTANVSSYVKTIGVYQVTVNQPDDEKLEFRGGNSDSTRTIPGGDISLSYLAADFIATRHGTIRLTINDLPAGSYFFRSYHLDSYTGSGFAFAQGSSTTTRNTIVARVGGVLFDSVHPTVLGASGLNTTFINDSQIPKLAFALSHDGSGPLVIDISSTLTNGLDQYLLLNGFELYHIKP